MTRNTIQPGDLLPVVRDISKEETLLFRADDSVTLLAVWENPETHNLSYLAQSPFTGEYSYLDETDLQPSEPAADDETPGGGTDQRQEEKRKTVDRLWERLASFTLILTVAILFFLGVAMFLFFLWPVNDAMSDIGELFLPFGIFLILLPTFLLGSPFIQRVLGAHDYNRQRTLILAQYAASLDAAYGPDGGTTPEVTFPTGQEKCMCWRCGAGNDENASSCGYCGAQFYYDWLRRLNLINIYTSTLLVWSTVQFFILFPIFLGSSFTDEFLQFYKYFYALCFFLYVLLLVPFLRVARFSPAQAFVSFALSPVPFLSMIYVYQRAQRNMLRERSIDLNHFRRGDGTVNVWHTMKDKQLKGIVTAFHFDTGKIFKERPVKRIQYLKHSARLDPLNHRVLYHLAQEHLANGDRMLGIYELDNALKLFPENAQYTELRTSMKSGTSPSS